MGINLKPHKTIRIAASHDVYINKLETLIIDTPEFQRLRKLRQLGSSDLIFPTALHNRFVHSLGTMQMASKMVRHIGENRHNDDKVCKISDEQHQLIRLVALLHDIGHLPYGHTIEDEFNIFLRHDEDQDRIDRLIGRDSRIGKILRLDKDHGVGNDLYERLFKILTTPKEKLHELGNELFIYDIVNNTVCADLLDYLQRDSFFCDLPVGLDYRFLHYLYLYEDTMTVMEPTLKGERGGSIPSTLFGPENGDAYDSKAEEGINSTPLVLVNEPKEYKVKRTAVRLSNQGGNKPRPDILNELVALLEYRYKLGEIVYFHHTKLASGSMIAGAVHRAKLDNKIKLSELYDMGDEKLIYTLQDRYKDVGNGDNPVKKLVDAFEQRRLWKASSFIKSRSQVDKEQLEFTDVDMLGAIEANYYKNPEGRLKSEREASARYGIADGDVLIHCPKKSMQSKLAQMNVFWEGKHRSLVDCQHNELVAEKLNLIQKSHNQLWAFRVFINPEVKETDFHIKKYFENELCFDVRKKKDKEKTAMQDWLKLEVKENYDIDKLSLGKYDEIENEILGQVLVETYGDRDISKLKKTVKVVCVRHGIIKKSEA